LTLNHTFSVNIWCYLLGEGHKTLFNKNEQITLAVNASGKMFVKIANVNTITNETDVFTPGFGVVPDEMWVNLVYSLEMSHGRET